MYVFCWCACNPSFIQLGRLGSGSQVLPWVHIDDVAALYVKAVEENAPTEVIHAVAPQRTTNAQFAGSLWSVFHRPTIYLPAFLVRLALGERASTLLEGQEVTPAFTQRFPFTFKFASLTEALTAIRDDHFKSE